MPTYKPLILYKQLIIHNDVARCAIRLYLLYIVNIMSFPDFCLVFKLLCHLLFECGHGFAVLNCCR